MFHLPPIVIEVFLILHFVRGQMDHSKISFSLHTSKFGIFLPLRCFFFEMEEKRQPVGRGKRTNPEFISCFKMIVFQNFI